MDRDQPPLGQQYILGLSSYISGAGEDALAQAYELGRMAVEEGLGVLDVVELHHRATTRLLQDPKRGQPLGEWLDLNGEFFKAALSAYEVTHLGFKEAVELLRYTVQFATIACHELRAPLTSVMTSAGMLQEVLDPAPRSQEGKLLANILAGAAKLKARTDSLTDMVGLESGTLVLKPSWVDVRSLILETCQSYEPQLIQAGLELNPAIVGHIPEIMADRGRLEQVLCNLVDNAIKYGSDGKTINVRAAAADEALLIEVQDFGKGIAIWDRPNLFRERFRGEGTRHQVQGWGIGLALCNAIITAHNGKIWVESEEGKGSTFTVSLPLNNPFH